MPDALPTIKRGLHAVSKVDDLTALHIACMLQKTVHSSPTGPPTEDSTASNTREPTINPTAQPPSDPTVIPTLPPPPY